MPNAMALVGEYAPKRIRVTAMMSVSCGFTAGAAVGGFIAAWLIPVWGWRSVFLFGGAIPLVIAVLMIFILPESISFLVLRGKDPERVAELMGRIDPTLKVSSGTRFVVKEKKRAGVPAIHLFREGRTKVTLLLWLVNFMNLLNLYFLSNWIPTLAKNAGFTTAAAVLAGATVQAGGTLGTFGGAWLINRAGFIRVLSTTFGVGAIAVACIGQSALAPVLFFVSVFAAGWCIPGAQPGVNALAGVYYPTDLRSTGIGWGLGIGRLGAIVGPLVGGVLIGRNWAIGDMFLLAALPAAVSAIAILELARGGAKGSAALRR
jgi:AAHS family 4-hydroxybenzoate transporter-like MFS transporter